MPALAAACALLLAAAAPDRVAVPTAAPPSRGRYLVSRADGGRGIALPAHEAFGWSQRARLLADGRTELTVVSLPRGARPLPAGTTGTPAAGAVTADAASFPAEIRALSEEIAHGATDPWTVSERVVTWVSLNVAHVDEPEHGESAAETLVARSGSCVGRSVLARDLLLARGIPARTIHGLLAEAAPGAGAFRLHRFLETWIDGLGWVPSDPGESVHVVDARHVFIATDGAPYDPESQRGLRLVIAETPAGSIGMPPRVAARPLVVASPPAPAGARRLLP